jgi:hypothetical protein
MAKKTKGTSRPKFATSPATKAKGKRRSGGGGGGAHSGGGGGGRRGGGQHGFGGTPIPD